MKKIFRLLSIAVVSTAAVSCLDALQGDSSGRSVKIGVNIEIPEQYRSRVVMEDVSVTVQSKSLPVSFTANPDASGKVEFEIAPDKYDILASYYSTSTRVSANGLVNEFILTGSGIVDDGGSITSPELELELSVSLPSPIVIRELFYHGSKTLEGGTGYTKDRYFEIYNNNGAGGATYYLDSLCIAGIFPYNSTAGNNAWKGADTLAIAQMCWMIPGDGSTYPLKPGESAVVAITAAVDHSARATSGLNLGKAHFGCYDESLSGHEISAGVTPTKGVIFGQGTAWAFSIHSPALVLFRPKMGVARYLSQAAEWERYEPGKTSGTKYWHIAKEWIIDGVECYDSPTGALKRLPASVDASYACMKSPHYSGKCITRKLDGIASAGGVDVYMDTNNSLADFDTDTDPAPRLKQ